MEINYNDGGRISTGYKGNTGDFVVRVIATKTELGYQTVCDEINHEEVKERISKRKKQYPMPELVWIKEPALAVSMGISQGRIYTKTKNHRGLGVTRVEQLRQKDISMKSITTCWQITLY